MAPPNFTTDLADVAHAIQLSVSPVFLLSGIGVLLTLLTNRLARIVDRARTLDDQIRAAPDSDRPPLEERLRDLSHRAGAIHLAIIAGVVAALLVALVVVLMFAGAFVSMRFGLAVALLFIAAMAAFIVALVAFLVEIRIAVRRESWERAGPRIRSTR